LPPSEAGKIDGLLAGRSQPGDPLAQEQSKYFGQWQSNFKIPMQYDEKEEVPGCDPPEHCAERGWCLVNP